MRRGRRARGGTLRARTARGHASLHFGPNMTPMVDVVMVILVFFMASAAFLGPEWMLKSLLPRPPAEGAGAEGAEAGKSRAELPPVRLEIALSVGAGGRVEATGVGKTARPIDEVLAALAGFAEGAPKEQIEVLIRADGRVPYREVVRVHEGAARVGVGRVGVAVSPVGGR
jgi:biopolymer transport protein ExbD